VKVKEMCWRLAERIQKINNAIKKIIFYETDYTLKFKKYKKLQEKS